MKSHATLTTFTLPAALCIAVSLGATTVRAADGDAAPAAATASIQPLMPPTVDNGIHLATVRLRSIEPDLMAWWLDPLSHARPAATVMGLSPETRHAALMATAANDRPIFTMPDGVQAVMPGSEPNTLLIVGTNAGIESLKRTILVLDKPTRQVELRARLVSMKTRDVEALGLSVPISLNAPASASVSEHGLVKPELLTKVDKLVKDGKAENVSDLTTTTFNDRPTTIFAGAQLPTSVTLGEGWAAKPRKGPWTNLLVSLRMTLEARVSLSNDGVMAVAVTSPIYARLATRQAPSEKVELAEESLVLGQMKFGENVILQSGQTCVLRGLRMRAYRRGGKEVTYVSGLPGFGLVAGSEDERGEPTEVLLFISARPIAPDIDPILDPTR